MEERGGDKGRDAGFELCKESFKVGVEEIYDRGGKKRGDDWDERRRQLEQSRG